jgi:hypothetical protein
MNDPGSALEENSYRAWLHLATVAVAYWQLDFADAERFFKALRRSRCSRAKELQWRFALIDAQLPTHRGVTTMDLQHMFYVVMTPAYVMHLLDDLVSEGRLTRRHASHLQDEILKRATAEGTWGNAPT